METAELIERCDAVASDQVRGAADLTLESCDILMDAIAAGMLDQAAARLRVAKPMMASLLNAVALAESTDDADEAFRLVLEFRDTLAAAPGRSARAAITHIKTIFDGPLRVVTISASSSVEETIGLMAAQHMTSSIVVGESRPECEGRAMAARLAGRIGDVKVTYDASLAGLVDRDCVVLIGADAVLFDTVVNKVGSMALCLAANRWSRPALVVTTSHKVLTGEARDYFRLPISQPDGDGFMDILFEEVPMDLVTAVITEGGAISGWSGFRRLGKRT